MKMGLLKFTASRLITNLSSGKTLMDRLISSRGGGQKIKWSMLSFDRLNRHSGCIVLDFLEREANT